MSRIAKPTNSTTRALEERSFRKTRETGDFRVGGEARPTLLLVDDVPANLLALEGMLRRDDIEIVTAGSGQEALEVLLECDVALALIDVQMPEMDGFELAALMRGVEKTRYVPIIFVTAGSQDRGRVFKGYEAGAVDYLFKPIDEQILRGKVDVFVTLDRHRRELLEADRMREMFIAVLGHDLRNPLNGIRMTIQLLMRRSQDESLREPLERVLRNQERMARMINQLLDVTRFRVDGGVSLDPEPADLEHLAGQILEELDENRGRFELEIYGETQGRWDRDRVMQILSNLMGNAAKHSPEDAPVRVRIDGSEPHAVHLSVQNGGDPIPQALRGVLFEPFRRAHAGRIRGEGLGLGLFITQQLVHAHGGSISYASSEEAGTCFTVKLPRHPDGRVNPDGSGTVTQAGGQGALEGDLRTILVVEDDPTARAALEELLEGSGYRVLVAARPSDALSLAASLEHPIDMVLTDLHLPEMSGSALASKLRQTHPALRIVCMSGDDRPQQSDVRFIQKPFDLDLLLRALEEAFDSDRT